MRNLPTPADDKYPYSAKVSQAALDLAPLAQTSSRKGEWPQFEGGGRPDSIAARGARRTATNPQLSTLSDLSSGNKLGGTVSATNTPLLQQGLSSRRGSPLGHPALGDLSSMSSGMLAARSVPGTPLGGVTTTAVTQLLKTPGTPLTPEGLSGRMGLGNQLGEVSASDLQASLSRLPSGQYEGTPLTFNSIHGNGFDDGVQVGDDITAYILIFDSSFAAAAVWNGLGLQPR